MKKTEKKAPGMAVRILLGIGVWFVSMLLVAIIGTALKLHNSEGIGATIYSLSVVIIPVVVAVLVAKPKKSPSRAPASRPNSNISATPKTHAEKSNDAQVEAVVQIQHEQTLDNPPTVSAEIKQTPTTKKITVVSNLEAAGIVEKTYRIQCSHHIDNILELASENYEYDMSKKELVDSGMIDEKIWKYCFYPSKTELVPEPDNPHDPKAIKVLVDGIHVGYIKAGSCAHLLKVINEGRIRGIDCDIGGGPYKVLTEEYDFDKERDVYTVENEERGYFVNLTVYESNS